MVVSEDSRDYVRHMFPGLRVERVRSGLDAEMYHPPAPRSGRVVASMLRRAGSYALQVVSILKPRGSLRGWELVSIRNRTERETRALRESAVFMTFNQREGFGLPPVEAMASGCVIIGWAEYGGREYMLPDISIPVAQGEVVALARGVERALRDYDEAPRAFDSIGARAATFVHERYYSPEHEREDELRFHQEVADV